ncbi:MAG: septum formation inhibitor Maf [Candidatus Kapaibacterium sp.]|nr:MAG: septum formation inhibitor Maf [Candidatus Kapabacteria bacterium]
MRLSAPLILASQSPRRKKLLEQIGVDFRVQVSDFDEESISPASMLPSAYVMALASAKARCVAEKLTSPAIVLGADTTVVVDGIILNKPSDAADAARMLGLLSNRSHEVFTGIALLETASQRIVTDAVRTEVCFRALEQEEIAAYIASGSPLDKAGSYGIQDDFGAVFVQEIRGCYNNVVGLPLERLYQHLRAYCP